MKPSTGVVALLVLLVLMCCPQIGLSDPPQDRELGSYVVSMSVDSSNRIQLLPAPYHAQPGDLILFDDHSKFIAFLYRLAGTSMPTHAAIVIRRPDGSIGLLEAGPNLLPDLVDKIFIFQLVPRLHSYAGSVFVRRLKTPLTEEQSANLTQFALAQEGKSYCWLRLAVQGTPFRPRGPMRKRFLGKTSLDRNRWTCSELTAAAATAAGILDPRIHFANAMYPRDFAYDENFDLSPYYYPLELWYPQAELQWVGNGVETGYRGPRRPLPR